MPSPQTKTPPKAELYIRHESALGEGPLWDEGALYWLDIMGKAIHSKRDDSEKVERHDVGAQIGSFVRWDNQRLVMAGEHGIQVYDMASRKVESWMNPEPSLPDNRFNDGKCDPKGRFVAGTYNRAGAPEKGALYVLDHDRSLREIYRPVTCSNGLAWSEDGKTLFYIDTGTASVRTFAYDLATARLSDERTVIRIPKEHGLPDGMSIDRAGNLWIGLWGGWGIECWSPVTGQMLVRIELPVERVTSCAFGGADYDLLYITTARVGLDDAGLAKQPLAGSVFRARPGVSGYKSVRYQSNPR